MTYEWGYTYGPPMAVAPLPNVRQVVEYALTEMPAAKIWLGVPNYGYDWPLPFIRGETKARSISSVQAVELARQHGSEIQYDERAQSPWFRYTDAAGVVHEVWFEDARSIPGKAGPHSRIWPAGRRLLECDAPLSPELAGTQRTLPDSGPLKPPRFWSILRS